MSEVAGYVADVAYPDRFHRELMPTWLHAVATALGRPAPSLAAGYRWLELGCAGGASALVAAACNPEARFVAVDVDAAQIALARERAREAGIGNIEFVAADLREYATRGGEPFDFIVSHGVWSWVAPDVRDAMLAIVRERLAPGGLAMVTYMCHPGASPLQSVQRLMREAARHVQGDSGARARTALGLVERLAVANAGFFVEHPDARRQVEAMAHEMPDYLAHEFLTDHWQPQHVADVIDAFAGAGCTHVGSATPLENIDAVSVPGQVQPLLQGLPSGALAETVRDLARNQSLRRDLYQRDALPLDSAAHRAALDAITFMALPGAPANGGLRLDTRIGPVECPAELFAPALRALAQGPQTFAALRALPPYASAPGLLNQVTQTLLWAGLAHPLRESALPASSAGFAWQPALRLLGAPGTAIAAGAR